MFSASELKRLDWIDIALHVAGAIALMVLPPIVVNTVFWPVREVLQKLKSDEYTHNSTGAFLAIFTRPQPLLEWLLPVIAGFALYGILT